MITAVITTTQPAKKSEREYFDISHTAEVVIHI